MSCCSFEQAAHTIEAGLSRPMELMKIFGQSGAGGTSADLPEVLVDKLKTLPGVGRGECELARRSEHVSAGNPA